MQGGQWFYLRVQRRMVYSGKPVTAAWSDIQNVGWYNHTRLHGEIGHVPPAEYEAMYYIAITTPRAA
jgi:transposase InsO family protein